MPRKSKEFLRRSRAAKKGWITRRRNQKVRALSAKKKKRSSGRNASNKRPSKVAALPSRRKAKRGKQGRTKTPLAGRAKRVPVQKWMWRLTTSINYVKKKVYQSFKITSYWKTEKEAIAFKPTQKRMLIKALEKFLRYDKKDWWFNYAISSQINQTAYDQRLIDLGPVEENEVV